MTKQNGSDEEAGLEGLNNLRVREERKKRVRFQDSRWTANNLLLSKMQVSLLT